MEKDKQNKVSFKEITPQFLVAVAKRMNSNKVQYGGKYEEFNWLETKNIQKEVLELIDATERHLIDLKALTMYNKALLNENETAMNHAEAITCNMNMIWNKLNNYGTESGI
jgi:hypothetical protein